MARKTTKTDDASYRRLVRALGGFDLETRKRVRQLQNKILAIVDEQQYPDDTIVSVDLPGLTMGHLRKFVYPQYEGKLTSVLDYIRGA